MKKLVSLLLVTVFTAALLTACGGKVSLNASYEAAADALSAAGYTVTTISDADGLSAYGADGLAAVVLAYQGSEVLETPDEDRMADYRVAELYYFETEKQAEAYYQTEDFQLGHQAWSDAFYHLDIKYNYQFSGSIAYAGTEESIDLCK